MAAAVAAAVAAAEDVGSRSRAAADLWWEREGGRARQEGGEAPEVEVRPREGGHERERVEPREELDNAARERDRPSARIDEQQKASLEPLSIGGGKITLFPAAVF